MEPIQLHQFTLNELAKRLDELPRPRREAYAEAACLDGAFTVGLPASWERVVRQMPSRGHGVARRVLKEDGALKEDLRRFNEESTSAIGPVWPSDRTQSEDPDQFLPQRGIFVRLEKLWDVYEDPELVLGFLLKQFVRTQALCRHLEVLGIPQEKWEEATGGAVDESWLSAAGERFRELDDLANELWQVGQDPEGERYRAWAERVQQCWRGYDASCRCWHWSSLNFYLYDDGTDLRRTPIRPVDIDGRPGFSATLLIEHEDSDFVASVANSQVGLQAKGRDGQWRTVEPGPLLINTGKAMQILAGGRYRKGEITGGSMRAIPHRVVLQGPSEEAVRRELESLQKRISIVGVTEPHGDEASLLTWDPERGELLPAEGLAHCKFWEFLVRRVPEV